MSIKVVYFPIPGRAESMRLALTLGGIKFEDQRLAGEEWGKMKAEVAPKQLPLLHVGGKVFGQSLAQLRYVSKISKFEGRALYPEDALLSLEVDEFVDMLGDMFAPISASYKMPEGAERDAVRSKAVSEGGDSHKWLKVLDAKFGKSKSGYAVGDHLTMADVAAFAFVQQLRSMEGVPATCLDGFKNIMAHKKKIASIPVVKDYYDEAEMPLYKVFQDTPLECYEKFLPSSSTLWWIWVAIYLWFTFVSGQL